MWAAAAPASPGDMGLYLGRQDRHKGRNLATKYTSEWHNSSILH